MKYIIYNIKGYELIFVLYILSGVYKVFLGLSVNLTLILSIILLFLINSSLFRKNYKTINNYKITLSLYTIMIFYGFMVSTLIFTKSQYFGYEKTILFTTVLLSYIYPILIFNFSTTIFLIYFVYISSIITIIYIPYYLSQYQLLLANYEDNIVGNDIYTSYLSMGYMMGVAFIITYFSRIFNKLKNPLSILLISGLLITGARGPLLAIILIVVIRVFFISGTFKKIKLKEIIVTAILLLCSIYYLTVNQSILSSLERTYDRVVSLEDINSEASARGRVEEAEYIIEMSENNPFLGYGIGSYGILRTGIDQKNYPHNILLEIFFELGIIGLLLFCFFLFLVIINIKGKNTFFLLAIFLYFFLNSLKSLSLPDHRIMFAFFSIIVLFNRKTRDYLK